MRVSAADTTSQGVLPYQDPGFRRDDDSPTDWVHDESRTQVDQGLTTSSTSNKASKAILASQHNYLSDIVPVARPTRPVLQVDAAAPASLPEKRAAPPEGAHAAHRATSDPDQAT